ncbi:MAG: TonB-dependent receptor, partial [Cetobacterium sp.]|uniref:TonB-dependent receptor n=5 Tax=Cetobacterium sp. TaxID=2071632 RepID=UPI003EE78072
AKSNVIVLVDGAPINSIDLSGYQTSNIPVDNIERIEVIPSGGSVLYGDGAVGGTINIVTKAPENKKNYGSLNSEIGSYGLKKQQITYGTKIGEKFLVEVDYLKREKDGYRDYSKDDLESFGFRSRYKLNDGELKFKYNYSKNEFKAPGWLFESEVNDDRTQSNSTRWRVDGKTEKNNFVGDYSYNINSDLEFKLLGTYTHENYSSNGSNYKTEIKYLKPQLRYSYLNENYIVFGGDVYAGETKNYSSKGDSKAEKNSLGGFIVNSYTIDKFRFTQGYRRQNIEYKGKNKNFSKKKFNEDAVELTGSYLYSDSGSTYVSYTKGFRAPNTDEINAWAGEFNPQKTETYEIGVKDFVGNTYISTSVFYIETENEIFYGVNKNDEFNKNRNLDGTSKRKGIEFSLEHYFNKLTISESITYMKTEFKDGKDIPGIPNIKGVLNFNYKFNEKLSMNNSWEYYGKSYDNNDEANEREKTDSYVLSGLTFIYDFQDGLVINAGINNLFNEKYYDYVGYKNPSKQDPTFGKTYYPAPERNYYIGFKYSF